MYHPFDDREPHHKYRTSYQTYANDIQAAARGRKVNVSVLQREMDEMKRATGFLRSRAADEDVVPAADPDLFNDVKCCLIYWDYAQRRIGQASKSNSSQRT